MRLCKSFHATLRTGSSFVSESVNLCGRFSPGEALVLGNQGIFFTLKIDVCSRRSGTSRDPGSHPQCRRGVREASQPCVAQAAAASRRCTHAVRWLARGGCAPRFSGVASVGSVARAPLTPPPVLLLFSHFLVERGAQRLRSLRAAVE